MRALCDEISALLAHASALDADVRADAPREARLLLAAVLNVSPGAIARRMHQSVSSTEHASVLSAAKRRARGEPLAYAVGTAPFRHLTLQVDARVLIPRPETEQVVEVALKETSARSGGVAVDIGTGSGAIALALATEGRFARVIATDISADALDVAAANVYAIAPSVPVELRLGADLAPLRARDQMRSPTSTSVRARVIVANPPYIAYDEAEALPASVRNWEPSTALFAPDHGMARYAALLGGAAAYLESDGVLVLEIDSRRGSETMTMAVSFGWHNVRVERDLSGRERVLIAYK